MLAHEIAHLSHRHGRFGAWTYRQRMMWGRLVTTMRHRRRPGHGLYTRFLAWYAPRFDVLTLAAARRHEYAADLAAADATSARSVAESLLEPRACRLVSGDDVLAGGLRRRPRIRRPRRRTRSSG